MRFEIEDYGYYYYRGEDHVPRRITIVKKSDKPGLYEYVDGHMTKEEIIGKQPEKKMIHANKVIL